MAAERRSTGMPGVDAQHDFLRARRRATLSRLAARLRGEPDDVHIVLPYEEVVEALGFVSERPAGAAVVALESIVGTVDRSREFDRSFRPTSGRVRSRWEQIAAAMRRGEPLPPVDLVRIGEIHFVRDGSSPRLGRPGAGTRRYRCLHHRGRHPRRRPAGDHAGRPAVQES